MSGLSIPIDFRVEPSLIADNASREQLLQKLCPLIENYSGPLTQVSSVSLPKSSNYHVLYESDNGRFSLAVKLYCNGLVSATLEFYTEEFRTPLIGVDESMQLEAAVRRECGAAVTKVLPGIKRSPPINPYYTTSDDRLLEYDIDEVVFSEQTKFQKVEIVHTASVGNILVLDNLQNLAESDLAYTEGLMNYGVDSYKAKTVLILGGGDGALMHELLKQAPAHVMMIDIDEAVMRSCKQHLRAVCGSTLDSMEGDNFQTIVADALPYLERFIKEGRYFDYVFADLTDVPISPGKPTRAHDEHWAFISRIMHLGLSVAKPGTGRYMTHATGAQCVAALKEFEDRLKGLSVGVSSVTRTERWVPSFMEQWCFFQATRSPLTQD